MRSQIYRLERLLTAYVHSPKRAFGRASPPWYRSHYTSSEQPLAPSTYIILVIPAACLGLGTWQVFRRQWKLKLIKELEEKTRRPPVSLPEELADVKDMEYQKVHLKGTFDYSRETFLGPRTLLTESGGLLSGSNTGGVHVVTPFRLADRDLTILVNRGWVPHSMAFPRSLAKGGDQPPAAVHTNDDQVVMITGVVRLTEERQPFTPKGVRTRGMWLRRDLDAMAEELGTAPVFVDAVGQAGHSDRYPVGSQTKVTLRNEHLSYILTWYSLAAITLWIFYARYLRKQPSRVASHIRSSR